MARRSSSAPTPATSPPSPASTSSSTDRRGGYSGRVTRHRGLRPADQPGPGPTNRPAPPIRWFTGCDRSARRSSRRCRRWPPGPARSTSARASRTPTARRRCWPRPPRRCATGQNQYPPGPGIPALRAAVAAHQRRFWGLDYDPDGEILVTAGATEAVAATILGALRAGRRGGLLRAVLRLVRGLDRTGRRGPPAGDAAPRPGRPVRLRPGRTARGVLPAYPAGAAQLAAQPDRQGLHRRRAGADRASCARSTTRTRSPTRSTSTWSSPTRPRRTSRWPPCPACASARCGSPRPARRSPAPGGRSAGPAARPALVSAVLRVKQFLTFVNAAPLQPAVAVALACPTTTTPASATACRPGGTSSCAGLTDAGFDVLPSGGDVLRHRRHQPARRPRRRGVLPLAAGALRRGGGADPGLLRRPGRGPAGWSGSPSASGPRSSPRRSAPPRPRHDRPRSGLSASWRAPSAPVTGMARRTVRSGWSASG